MYLLGHFTPCCWARAHYTMGMPANYGVTVICNGNWVDIQQKPQDSLIGNGKTNINQNTTPRGSLECLGPLITNRNAQITPLLSGAKPVWWFQPSQQQGLIKEMIRYPAQTMISLITNKRAHITPITIHGPVRASSCWSTGAGLCWAPTQFLLHINGSATVYGNAQGEDAPGVLMPKFT